jgi:hypothetical protein
MAYFGVRSRVRPAVAIPQFCRRAMLTMATGLTVTVAYAVPAAHADNRLPWILRGVFPPPGYPPQKLWHPDRKGCAPSGPATCKFGDLRAPMTKSAKALRVEHQSVRLPRLEKPSPSHH